MRQALRVNTWPGSALVATMVLLTLGTGVGGAILSEGRLVSGQLGRAGHVGHICLDPMGQPPSGTPVPGALETYICNATLPQRSNGRFSDTRTLVAAHLAGDREATEIWLRSVHRLACGLSSIINVVDPEVVILGGGIAQAGPALFEPLAGYLDARILSLAFTALNPREIDLVAERLAALHGGNASAFAAVHHALSPRDLDRGLALDRMLRTTAEGEGLGAWLLDRSKP